MSKASRHPASPSGEPYPAAHLTPPLNSHRMVCPGWFCGFLCQVTHWQLRTPLQLVNLHGGQPPTPNGGLWDSRQLHSSWELPRTVTAPDQTPQQTESHPDPSFFEEGIDMYKLPSRCSTLGKRGIQKKTNAHTIAFINSYSRFEVKPEMPIYGWVFKSWVRV